jgi:hypothetical protein
VAGFCGDTILTMLCRVEGLNFELSLDFSEIQGEVNRNWQKKLLLLGAFVATLL